MKQSRISCTVPWHLVCSAIFAVCMVVSATADAAEKEAPKEVIAPEDFAGSLEYLGIAVKKPGVHVWGSSPVIDRETGKVHLFVAEWDARKMGFGQGWWHISQIAHHVGDSPEGPFRFVDYVVQPIQVGNTIQLLLDESLIAHREGATYNIEKGAKAPVNPVIKPDELWERSYYKGGVQGRRIYTYGMTPFVRGDLILGFLQAFDVVGRGPARIDDGHIESQLAYSRDVRTWYRFKDRTPIIPVGPSGSYDGGMIMMVCNGPLINGDKMTVYYTAANTTHGDLIPNKYFSIARIDWPLDRLASLTAGETEAVVETVVLNAPAGKLMLNADAQGGYVVVEVLDAKGNVLTGFSGEECVPIAGDSLEHCVKWENGDLAKVKQPIRLRFRMKNAKLYTIRFELRHAHTNEH